MNENQKRPPHEEDGRSGTNYPEPSFMLSQRPSKGVSDRSHLNKYWTHLMAKDAAVMARRCRCERST